MIKPDCQEMAELRTGANNDVCVANVDTEGLMIVQEIDTTIDWDNGF